MADRVVVFLHYEERGTLLRHMQVPLLREQVLANAKVVWSDYSNIDLITGRQTVQRKTEDTGRSYEKTYVYAYITSPLMAKDASFNVVARPGPSGGVVDALIELLEILERKALAALEACCAENQAEWVEVKDK